MMWKEMAREDESVKRRGDESLSRSFAAIL